MTASRNVRKTGPKLLQISMLAAILSAFAQVALADVVEQGVKDSKPSGLLAGVAKININPPFGAPQSSWGSATHIASKAVDPNGLWIRALVLSDGKMKFALVDTDGGGGDDASLAQASKLTGIPVEHIRTASSHTHAGPGGPRVDLASAGIDMTGIDMGYLKRMMAAHRASSAEKFVSVIVEANKNLRPVHMYGGTGTGSINVSRRFRGKGWDSYDMPPAVGLNFEAFSDKQLPVFRIDDAQGDPYVIMVNYGAHPTSLAYENTTISPDYPGAMRNTVEAVFAGATCLWFQGAAGDQGPIEGFSGDVGVPHRLGKILGLEAAAAAARISTVRREPQFEGYVQSNALQAKQPYRVLGPRDATMKYATKIVELPGRTFTKADLEMRVRQAALAEKEVQAVSQKAGATVWEKAQAAAKLRRLGARAKRVQEFFDKGAVAPPPVRKEVAVLKIGDLAMVLTGGENFSQIGAEIKKGSPFAVTMFCGYGNHEGAGYFPVTSEYDFGGYEVAGTRYGRGASEKFITETIALLKSIR